MSDKSGTSEQIISLPKGGGALKGIGETLSPDLHTGTGNFTVPIVLPPGRNGFQPQLNLVYSTGNGNGFWGLGWGLSIPGVSRMTSHGVPRYRDYDSAEEPDVLILSGAEDLVPVPVATPGPGCAPSRPVAVPGRAHESTQDGATRRPRTAYLTRSECLVSIPGIPNPDKYIIRGRKHMDRKLVVSLVVPMALLLAVTGAIAQSPQVLAPQAALGPGFSYQGQIKQAGGPVNKPCDLQFSLWDAAGSGSPPSGGTQVGSRQTLLAVPMMSGLFTVEVNANNEFGSNAFTGEARWLQVAVRCPAGSGTYTTLSPRQKLTATPYALSLMPNATINGLNNTGNLSFGSNTRQMLNLWGTQYGLGVQSYDTYFRTDSGAGFAWFEGGSHSDSHYDAGPWGITLMTLDGSNGLTVGGKVSATTSSTSPDAAVLGKNYGSGYGVYGWSAAGSGVIGESSTSDGVVGVGSGTGSAGVRGLDTNGGYGVAGISDTCASGTCAGVYGRSNLDGDVGGTGVLGDGARYGVRGDSFFGNGVHGATTAGYGVYGTSHSPLSSGVYGESTNGGYGVEGHANGAKAAVLGRNDSAGGTGVRGEAAGLNAYGVYGINTVCVSGMNCYAIYSDGNFAVAPGWTKSAIVNTESYGDRKLYAMESPGNWFEDFGSGQLEQGTAMVTIDPIFAQTVNLAETYHVFLTPLGDCLLYVSEKTPTSFTVKAASGGTCSVGFDYRIIAKRLGFENVRLEPAIVQK